MFYLVSFDSIVLFKKTRNLDLINELDDERRYRSSELNKESIDVDTRDSNYEIPDFMRQFDKNYFNKFKLLNESKGEIKDINNKKDKSSNFLAI